MPETFDCLRNECSKVAINALVSTSRFEPLMRDHLLRYFSGRISSKIRPESGLDLMSGTPLETIPTRLEIRFSIAFRGKRSIEVFRMKGKYSE